MRDEFKRWLSEALWNLETAKILHECGRYNAACFYAHQAAEMAVKALLTRRNESPLGYGIRVLLERYSQISGEDVSSMLPKARELDSITSHQGIPTLTLRALLMKPMMRRLPLEL